MTTGSERKLTKDEMDVLLQAQKSNDLPADMPEQPRRVKGYDFRQPSRFNRSEMDRLKRMHEEMAEHATNTASKLLGESIKAQLVSMDHMKWEDLLEEHGESVMAFTFLMKPLVSHGLVSVDRKFAAFCIDRMMGGTSLPEEGGEHFSGLDLRVLACFVRTCLASLPKLWERIGQFEVEVGSHVHDLQALRIFQTGQDMFQITFLFQGEGVSGQLIISVPFRTVRSLPPESEEPEGDAIASAEAEALLLESLKQTPVQISMLLGTVDIRFQDLVELAPGDLITLDTHIQDPLDVRINDKVKLKGYPGTCRGKIALKLITGG